MLVLLTVNLYSGLNAAAHSTYWSEAQVFHSFMNSPLRIVLPVAVALLAGVRTIEELSHHFVASTRAREDVRRRVARRFLREAATVGAIFAGFAIVNVIAAWVVVPAVWPAAIDPASAGLTTQVAVYAADVDISPLAAATAHGPALFAVATAAWLGGNAAVLALVTVSAVYLIKRPLVALFVPFGIYLGESVITQVAGVPAASFLISMIYPSGLQHYALSAAVAPSVILATVAIGCATAVILTSRRNTRLS